jgi:hypothetical protein
MSEVSCNQIIEIIEKSVNIHEKSKIILKI